MKRIYTIILYLLCMVPVLISQTLNLSPNNSIKNPFAEGNDFYDIVVSGFAAPAAGDIDSDGDIDLLIGVEDGSTKYYKNVNGNYVDSSVNLVIPDDDAFAVPCLGDIDGDNDLDLVLGIENGRMQTYLNIGDGDKPYFVKESRPGYALNPHDVGLDASPSIGRMDDDQYLDALVGNETGILYYYIFSGDADSIAFELITPTPDNMDSEDVGTNSSVCIVDLDLNGKNDVLVGSASGKIEAYKFNNPNYNKYYAESPFEDSLSSSFCKLSAIDYDGDNDFDLIVGGEFGNIRYYEDIQDRTTYPNKDSYFVEKSILTDGAVSMPVIVDYNKDGINDVFFIKNWGKIGYATGAAKDNVYTFTRRYKDNNPFRNIHAKAGSSATIVDADLDGDDDVVIVIDLGTFQYYENTGTNLSPAYTKQTGGNNPFNSLDYGAACSITSADIDGDDDDDIIVTELSGGTIHYLQNDGTTGNPSFNEITGGSNPFDGINGGNSGVIGLGDYDADGDLDFFIGANNGTLRYVKNTGDKTNPVFAEQFSANNPLSSVDVGSNAKPFSIDIDFDGDQDVLIANKTGQVKIYTNQFNTKPETGTIDSLSTLVDSVFQFILPDSVITDVDIPANNDTLTYTVTLTNGNPLPGWLSFDDATETFSGTAEVNDTGLYKIKILIEDRFNAKDSTFLQVFVNDLPIFIGEFQDQSWTTGGISYYYFKNDISYYDPQPLQTGVKMQDGSIWPEWLYYDKDNQRFVGEPRYPANIDIDFMVTDAYGGHVFRTFNITVTGDTIVQIGEQPESPINAFPNPSDGIFQIHADQPGIIKIVSMCGRTICQKQVDRTEVININDAASGIYTLIYYNNKTIIKKLIVKE